MIKATPAKDLDYSLAKQYTDAVAQLKADIVAGRLKGTVPGYVMQRYAVAIKIVQQGPGAADPAKAEAAALKAAQNAGEVLTQIATQLDGLDNTTRGRLAAPLKTAAAKIGAM